ncbi:MAG TPA: hypothetical protein VFQ79_14675 [Bryobacteraceae bacterium]|nr:hypothetical protein [Bryobacteraceae bacterium]
MQLQNRLAIIIGGVLLMTVACSREAPPPQASQDQPPPSEQQAPAATPAPVAPPRETAKERPAARPPARQPESRVAESKPQTPVTEPPPARPEPVAPQPVTATLEAGTQLRIRTIEAISTKTAKKGDTFSGTLVDALRDGDRLIAPRGANVAGIVTESDPGGRVKGRASLSVQLTRLGTDYGGPVDISTGAVSVEAQGSKAKDARNIGIGAGIGAAIGAIAGGGKGAAIGAGAGAAAGTGATLATHGEAATIPSETVLTFELRRPVTVRK